MAKRFSLLSLVQEKEPSLIRPLLIVLIREIFQRSFPSFQGVIDRALGRIDQKIKEIDLATPELREKFDSESKRVIEGAARSDSEELAAFLSQDDPWGALYQGAFPKQGRLKLGEFFTPAWLADDLTKRAFAYWDSLNGGVPSDSGIFPYLLDPACGSGAFLRAAYRMGRTRGASPREICRRLAGWDLTPFSVFLGRASLALQILRESSAAPDDFPPSVLPVYLYDSLRGKNSIFEDASDVSEPQGFPWTRKAELILGNPPWIQWDSVSLAERRELETLWKDYGFFTLRGMKARMGGGKKESAGLFLYAAADRYLKTGGVLGMILPLSLLKSGLSGDGFRRLQIGEAGENLALRSIDDFSLCSPFSGVSSPVGAVILRKGEKTTWPVAARLWQKAKGGKRAAAKTPTVSPISYWAVPASPEKPNSALRFYRAGEPSFPCPSVNLGQEPNFYRDAQLGVNTAGANGIFWFRRVDEESCSDGLIRVQNLPQCGKRKIPALTVTLESDLLYPLVRWGDAVPFHAEASALILLTQDPKTRRGWNAETMKERYPRTFAYLKGFDTELTSRAAYQKFQKGTPFWSLYNLNQTTLAPIKVVWRRMDTCLRAAVLLPDSATGKPRLPQETLSMTAVDTLAEADYLAQRLNSPEIRALAASVSLPRTKGFGSPSLLPLLKIPRFDNENREHREISEAGKKNRENH